MKRLILLLFLIPLFATAQLPYPVGSVSLTGGAVQFCPSGATCSNTSVDTWGNTCKAVGMVGVFEPTPPLVAQATVIMFGGSNGGAPYTINGFSGNTFIQDLLGHGYRIVEIWWNYSGWDQNQTCGNTYPIQGASRIAATIKWAYNGGDPSPASLFHWPPTVPLIALGGSAGTSGIILAMEYYHADQWLALAILQSADPMWSIDQGCEAGYSGYTYDATGIDILNGFFHDQLCGSGQINSNWATNSTNSGGNRFWTCKTTMLLGLQDSSYITNRGQRTYESAYSAGTNIILRWANSGHSFMSNPVGEAAVEYSVFNDWQSVSPTPAPSPIPTPTATIPPTPTPTPSCTCP